MKQEGKFERELDDLRSELENFHQEKERVRAIIGQIGGVPTFNTRFFNWFFICVIVVSLIVSFLLGDRVKLAMIEFATVALSAKILYMMHCQTRVNHFQLWMQSSIEWRINEITKLLREIQKEQEGSKSA